MKTNTVCFGNSLESITVLNTAEKIKRQRHLRNLRSIGSNHTASLYQHHLNRQKLPKRLPTNNELQLMMTSRHWNHKLGFLWFDSKF
jgi:hypothetical protein